MLYIDEYGARYIQQDTAWEEGRMRIILTLAALVLAGNALAAEPETCPATPVAPPARFADWPNPRPLSTVTKAGDLAQALFTAGEAVDLRLHPDGEVAYQTLPQGAGEAKSFGGMARFTVTEASLYQVGLGSPAWVYVVREGGGSADRCFPSRPGMHGHSQGGELPARARRRRARDPGKRTP